MERLNASAFHVGEDFTIYLQALVFLRASEDTLFERVVLEIVFPAIYDTLLEEEDSSVCVQAL